LRTNLFIWRREKSWLFEFKQP